MAALTRDKALPNRAPHHPFGKDRSYRREGPNNALSRVSHRLAARNQLQESVAKRPAKLRDRGKAGIRPQP
jgi:hypothetical protein